VKELRVRGVRESVSKRPKKDERAERRRSACRLTRPGLDENLVDKRGHASQDKGRKGAERETSRLNAGRVAVSGHSKSEAASQKKACGDIG